MNQTLHDEALGKFRAHFHAEPDAASYAPGRIEVLGNHTDYNEGFVLSAAIDLGTVCLVQRSNDNSCRVVAGDLMQECAFPTDDLSPSDAHPWANYVKGVYALLFPDPDKRQAFHCLFFSSIPLAAGLSSSAALEVSSALALSKLAGIDKTPLDIARIAQKAEHEYAGVRCGLLDQISSLFGNEGACVITDFRSLDIKTVPLGKDAAFLMCNTGVKHTLVDSEYNERRAKCEEAARFFASVLPHPVAALRDVSLEEWQQFSSQMDVSAAKRSAHVIGENTRVTQGRELLAQGRLSDFGQLMYESHTSSRTQFENSCEELDFLVDAAKDMPKTLGARLSGGGFGGSVVILVRLDDADKVGSALAAAYAAQFGNPCDTRLVHPSAGARLIA